MDAHKECTHPAIVPSTLSWNIQSTALWQEIIRNYMCFVFVLDLLRKDRLIMGLFNTITTSIFGNYKV